ncbi:hypothetical protein CDA63_16815 [Hymenobacter amundsenii]|uniref:Uncharacterized protein n=1 Tax=Hymenobacter amundsenii TaxID=2006685 RepID=A0A246FH99_9BACT|nr:hypothetical protein CDA63_16815 [Hymenobacter amundsenii]
MVVLVVLLAGLAGVGYQFLASLNPIEGMRAYTTSSKQSKAMGVFDRYVQVKPQSLRHDSLYSLRIEEAYLEKYWVCDEGCISANEINSVGSKTLIVRLQRSSDATGLQDTYFIRQQHGANKSALHLGQDGVLLDYINADLSGCYPSWPLKYYVYKGRYGADETLLDSLTVY